MTIGKWWTAPCAFARTIPARGQLLALCLVAAAALLLWGCGGAQVDIRHPIRTNLRSYPYFVFSAQSGAEEDTREELLELHQLVMKRVQAKTRFQRYGAVKWIEFEAGETAPAGTLVVQAMVQKIRKVSGAAKSVGGALAGTAQMTTAVWVTDGATGQDIGMFVVEVEASTTGSVVSKTAKEIARVIIRGYNA